MIRWLCRYVGLPMTVISFLLCLSNPAWSLDQKKLPSAQPTTRVLPKKTTMDKATLRPALRPDLVIVSIAMPVAPKAGEPIDQSRRINITVKNIGKSPAPACQLSIAAGFVYVPQTPAPPELSGNISVPQLGPGARALISWPNVNSKAKWIAGEYRFLMTVDALNTVIEADENHNSKTFKVVVFHEPSGGRGLGGVEKGGAT